ncbi:MAG: sel1 repeat family protein [Verrucomicrobia bacterium]|nr:sel1 repeat family protein [Verrucomicrobiota bacterium]
MLQNLIAIKLAVMASALGLNTAEWSKPSPAIEAQVQKLENAIKLVGKQEKADEMQKDLNDASAEIKKLADAGDKDAQFAMGLLLSNQQGQMDKVVEYYSAASKQGQLQAMNNLGYIIAASSRDTEKQKEGVALIKKASDGGLNAARRNMAQIYLNGMAGEARDVNAAEKLLITASEAKDADATYMLSQLYLGAGGPEKQSDAKGFELLKKAAKDGNATALDTLGTLYLQGGSVGGKADSKGEKVGAIEVKPDPKAAVAQFEELAKANNPVGLRKMGGVYEQGIEGVVAKDFQKAVEYYVKAAQGNDALAQFRLGSMYDTGVQLDPKSDKIEIVPNAGVALSYYKLAAQNKMAIASFNVGIFYEQGRGVDKDIQKAFAYYMQAAQEGVNVAMQKIGDSYINGAGTIKDPVAAAGWYARSAAAGLPEGSLRYGVVIESGLTDKENPFHIAADYYKKAYNGAAVLNAAAKEATPPRDSSQSDAIGLEAYLRLGSLFARGVFVPKGDAPKPDWQRAYVFFKMADDITGGKNKIASEALAQAEAKVDPTQKKMAEAQIKSMNDEIAAYVKQVKDKAGATESATPAATAVRPTTGTSGTSGTKTKTKTK